MNGLAGFARRSAAAANCLASSEPPSGEHAASLLEIVAPHEKEIDEDEGSVAAEALGLARRQLGLLQRRESADGPSAHNPSAVAECEAMTAALATLLLTS